MSCSYSVLMLFHVSIIIPSSLSLRHPVFLPVKLIAAFPANPAHSFPVLSRSIRVPLCAPALLLAVPPIGWPAFPCRLACPPCHSPSAVVSHRYLAGRYIIRPGRYFTPAPPDPANNPKHWRPGRLISALCAPRRTSERRACRRHSSFPRAVPTETMGKDGLESLARPHSTASGATEKCSLHRGAGQT